MTLPEIPVRQAIVVASYRRSGTHLTIDTLLNNLADVHSEYLNVDQLSCRHRDRLTLDQVSDLFEKAGDRAVIIKTHSPDSTIHFDSTVEGDAFSLILGKAKRIYVCRDPRDVMVSSWYYQLSFNPEYSKKTTFSNHIVRFAPEWKNHVNHWLLQAAMLVRFEDWAQNYDETLASVAKYLGVRLKEGAPVRVYGVPQPGPHRLLARLSAPFRRQARLTAVAPRKGVVGDWQNHFSPADEDEILSICEETLLQRLGYL